MATTTRARATEADLLSQPADGSKYELVDGEIRVSPGGARHGHIEMKLGSRLLAFATTRQLGHVFGSSVGFRLPGGNVRSPDVSFVSAGRFPAEKIPDDFADLAPTSPSKSCRLESGRGRSWTRLASTSTRASALSG
jgi:Uma2 family endonuclease